MSLEAIKMVNEAEQYAQDLRTDTQTKIKKIKSDCEREGREMLELSLNQASEEVKRLIADAEQRADRRAGEITGQSRLDCEALNTQASGNYDKAVKYIVERIVIV